MQDIATKIAGYQATVNKRVQEKAKLEGQYESVMERLKALGFDNIEDAKAYIETEGARVRQAEEELRSDVEEFGEVYGSLLN